MAVDVAELTDEQLRQQTLAWLQENLPPGWMDAVERDDDGALRRLRARLNYDDWCKRLGEAGYATPTWPAEYGAGLSLTPGQAKHVNDVLFGDRPRFTPLFGLGSVPGSYLPHLSHHSSASTVLVSVMMPSRTQSSASAILASKVSRCSPASSFAPTCARPRAP